MSPISLERISPMLLRPRTWGRGSNEVPHFETDDLSITVENVIGVNGFVTSPLYVPKKGQFGSGVCNEGTRLSVNIVCRFSAEDFTPRAPPVNTQQCQSLGKYHSNCHECRETRCPFTERGMLARRNAMMAVTLSYRYWIEPTR